ncbi:MAG: hypothetical protein ACT4OL_12060 [Nitrospiraceae bacterium]
MRSGGHTSKLRVADGGVKIGDTVNVRRTTSSVGERLAGLREL